MATHVFERPLSYESILSRCKTEDETESYQQTTVNELVEITEEIFTSAVLKRSGTNDIVLKAPTGSGKTIITGGYIDSLFHNHAQIIVLWISETPNLTKQSLDKLKAVFNLQTSFYGEDVNLTFANKSVIGINWEKIKNLKARTDTETSVSIDSLVSDAQKAGYQVVTVIDEAHTHADSKLSREFLATVKSDVILNVTATPQREYSFDVTVDIDAVQRAGFIKQGIVINDLPDDYTDGFRQAENVNDLTEYFLHQSLTKRNQLEAAVQDYVEDYNALGKQQRTPFVPLLVVQLPNNSAEMMKAVEDYFARNGLSRENGALAVYTSGDYTDELDSIGKDPTVKVLLFKQAISKGWDCPRASVITLLREPKRQHFVTQTIGRILRMPYLEAYAPPYDLLNYGYVYIEEMDNSVLQSVMNDIRKDGTAPTLYRNEGIVTEMDALYTQVWVNQQPKIAPNVRIKKIVNLATSYVQHDEWFDYLDARHGLSDVTHFTRSGKIGTKNLIETADIELDGQELQETQFTYSDTDVVREFEYLCKRSGVNLDDAWSLVEDVLEPAMSHGSEVDLVKAILNHRDAFITDFTKLYEELGGVSRDDFVKVFKSWQVPARWVVPIDAEPMSEKYAAKTPYAQMWLKRNSLEQAVVDYLNDNTAVELWYKNGDNGSLYFSIAYAIDGKHSHFYPDFLAETADTIYILESKGDLDGDENIEKVKSLSDYRINYLSERDDAAQPKNIVVGYVKTHKNTLYVYTGRNFKKDRDGLTGWDVLDIN